jgi:thiol-disulfide isomerase/thioredoxin
MRNAIITLLIFSANFCYNIAIAQQLKTEQELQGKVEIIIDVSNMKDTAGKFLVMVGGELFYPNIKNNALLVNKELKEPRRSYLAFFPNKKIQVDTGKSLNEISAEASDNLYFLAVPGKNEIVINGTLSNSEISKASVQQKKYFSLLKLKENFDTLLMKQDATLLTALNDAKDIKIKDSLFAVYIQHYRKQFPKYYQDVILGFVRNNPDSPASLIELEEYSSTKDMDLKLLTFLYNNLSDRIKALPTAKRIFTTIDSKSFAANNMLGKQALNFTQNDPAGKPVSLTNFKGHVTLLEFWASWCGPCRASNPALVKTYQKFNNKGFRILGVSLDDNKESWLKAIKDDGLIWTHTSDLKFFQNSVATLYHVSFIPSNFLIDRSGKIIASDLDEKALNEQLKKLLK